MPFVRGIFNFIDSLRIGYKCLMRSAELSGLEEEEDKKDEKKSVSPKLMSFLMALSAVLGVAVAVVLFVNRRVLGRSVFRTFSLWLIDGGVFALVFFVFRTDHFRDMRFLPLVSRGLLHMLWIVPLYVVANAVLQPRRFKGLLCTLKGRMKKA